MGFFFWGTGGSYHGQLGMGAQATEATLGFKEPGIFRRRIGAAFGLHHGQCCIKGVL